MLVGTILKSCSSNMVCRSRRASPLERRLGVRVRSDERTRQRRNADEPSRYSHPLKPKVKVRMIRLRADVTSRIPPQASCGQVHALKAGRQHRKEHAGVRS